MWLRRAFFHWLVPAAFVLPLWLLVGWGVFQAGAWVFLWVLFIAVPSVFLGQLALALLVRSRPTVRAERAVSWWDVGGFTLWHVLTVLVGFYSAAWFVPALVGAIVVGLGLFWLSLWQLWSEARSGVRSFTVQAGAVPGGSDQPRGAFGTPQTGAFGTPQTPPASTRDGEFIVITETPRAGDESSRR